MSRESRNKLYSFLYLLALYLAVRLLPLSEWIPSDWGYRLVEIVLLAVVFVLALFEVKRGNITLTYPAARLSFWWLLPFLLGTASNLFYCLFFQKEVTVNITWYLFLCDIFLTILGVLIEEYLFRYILFSFYEDIFEGKKNKDIAVILISALSFALLHVVNFYGNNPIAVLIQIAYTFVLGIFLGLIAYYFESPWIPIAGHFLFNFLNTNLFLALYSIELDSSYYIFNVCVGVVLFLYSVLVYIMARRKNTPHVTG